MSPVSYTHLDVYKRQISDSALIHKMIHEIYYFEGVVTVMSLSYAVNGFSGEIAWNLSLIHI